MALAVIMIIVVVAACCILPMVSQLIKRMAGVITGQFPILMLEDRQPLHAVPNDYQTWEEIYTEMREVQTARDTSDLDKGGQIELGDI